MIMFDYNCQKCGCPVFRDNPHRTGIDEPYPLCKKCHKDYCGYNEQNWLFEHPYRYEKIRIVCNCCDGSGKNKEYKCVHCKGSGYSYSCDQIPLSKKELIDEVFGKRKKE